MPLQGHVLRESANLLPLRQGGRAEVGDGVMWEWLQDKWEFGVFMIGAFVGLRTKRIDERIKEIMNPDLLTNTLQRIESTVTAIDQKVDELAENVAYLNGKDEARSEGRSVVNPSNATLRLRQ
jgi:hypothetical protein